MRPHVASTAGGLLVALLLGQSTSSPAVCPRCGWRPPAARRVVEVSTIDQLERAVDAAKPGDAIVVADGKYALRRILDIHAADVTLRGRSGDPARVILHGRGMTGDIVGVALSISAAGVTIADVTVRDVGNHAVQVRGERGASRFTLHNARLVDAGEQLLKGSISNAPVYADDGLVACSEFVYTTHAPSNYTNGVGMLGVKGWRIRDNRFTRIRGPEAGRWSAGPAILVWAASEDTVVERNVIVDSFRGIALGLGLGYSNVARHGERTYDHLRGLVRNNVVVNLNAWADEAIEANAAREVRLEHNTVLVEGSSPWSIGVRFPSASATVTNNLTNHGVLLRDGGRGTLEGNVAGATRAWFVDAPHRDLHLAPGGLPAVDAGVPIPDLNEDFDRRPRVAGKRPDAGAFELRGPGG